MGIKLLLADDSITIQKVVGIIFANEDYELTLVDNGDAAMDKARELVPDVFLVDALMPGKTGYEVCTEVRQDPKLKNVPLLLLTGAFEQFDEDRARKCGADDFITKPFESQQLIERVEKLFALGQERASAAPAVTIEAPAPVAATVVGADSWGDESMAAGASEIAWEETAPAAQEEQLWEEMSSVPEIPPAFELPVQDAALDLAPEPVAVAPVVVAPLVETVEAAPEDDLWGAFELEEEAETVEFGDVIGAEKDIFAGEIEEIEPLSLMEEEENEEALPVETVTGFGAEDTPFAFEEVSAPEPEPFAFAEEVTEPEPFAISEEAFASAAEEPVFAAPEPEPPVFAPFEESAPEFATSISSADFEEQAFTPAEQYVPAADAFAAPVAPLSAEELVFAPEEEYVPTAALAAPVAPAVVQEQVFAPAAEAFSAPVSSTAPAAVAPAEAAITEEQLVAALSRLSRDVIEKIVWEVVPDLAETLIKEEIRKIREQA
jgi:CheY-like chemotaxis protein